MPALPEHSTPGVCLHLPWPTCLRLGCFQNPLRPPNPVAVIHFTWWWMVFCGFGFFFPFGNGLFSVSLLSLPSLCFAACLFPLSSALFCQHSACSLPCLPTPRAARAEPSPAAACHREVDGAEQVSVFRTHLLTSSLLVRSKMTLILLWLLKGKRNSVSLLPFCLQVTQLLVFWMCWPVMRAGELSGE